MSSKNGALKAVFGGAQEKEKNKQERQKSREFHALLRDKDKLAEEVRLRFCGLLIED